jgi:hypothetical protein
MAQRYSMAAFYSSVSRSNEVGEIGQWGLQIFLGHSTKRASCRRDFSFTPTMDY